MKYLKIIIIVIVIICLLICINFYINVKPLTNINKYYNENNNEFFIN